MGRDRNPNIGHSDGVETIPATAADVALAAGSGDRYGQAPSPLPSPMASIARSLLRRSALVAAAVLPAAAILCACSAMTTSDARKPRYPGAPNIDRPYTRTVADWPLFFVKHNFTAQCFDTQYCLVNYGGFAHEREKPTPSIASLGENYPDVLTGAERIGIENFAGPVEIDWRSKDNTPLWASLDLDAIFKERLVPIPPGVTRDEIPDEIGIGPTTIVVEVVDRTVNVWTRTHIPMKELQTPGNRYSDFNADLVKVYSRTY